MREHGVDGVGDRRVDRVAGLVARSEHEVVDQQLGSPVEQLGERLLAVLRVEAVVLVHGQPRQVASFLRELVAEPRVLLLADQQLLACGVPLFRVAILWSVIVPLPSVVEASHRQIHVVPVIPLALSDATKAATSAISSSVMSRRGWVRPASACCHCSQVIPDASARGS